MTSKLFDPKDGEFAKNVRSEIGDDLTELRESMRASGWLKEFPALADENGVVLVGHRRMKVAAELAIEPVITVLAIGAGDEGDAHRLRLAIASNIGARPMTPADRKRIAERLYGEHNWTMERIGEALSAGKSTIARDLVDFPTAGKSKDAKKTAGNPRGSGRSRGKPKPRDKQVRDEEIIARADAGETAAQIGARVGLVPRRVSRIIEDEALVRKGKAEPDIDPATLSMTAQQKLASALAQHKRALDARFHQTVRDEVQKFLAETLGPILKKEQDEARALEKAFRTKGLMNKDTFNTIRRCLHPDSRKSVSDNVLAKAFDKFQALERFVLSAAEAPTKYTKLPETAADWDKLKAAATAARKAKRPNSKQTVARR